MVPKEDSKAISILAKFPLFTRCTGCIIHLVLLTNIIHIRAVFVSDNGVPCYLNRGYALSRLRLGDSGGLDN
jgi:hypothetical protein